MAIAPREKNRDIPVRPQTRLANSPVVDSTLREWAAKFPLHFFWKVINLLNSLDSIVIVIQEKKKQQQQFSIFLYSRRSSKNCINFIRRSNICFRFDFGYLCYNLLKRIERFSLCR